MRSCATLRSSCRDVLQTLTLAVVLLGLFTSTIWEPAWATDSASATSPASVSSATTAPARAHEASRPDQPPNLPDVQRQQTSAQASPALNLSAANQMLQRQGPVFIENRGQFDPRVKFLVKGNGANLWLTNEGIVFDFQRPTRKQSPDATEEKRDAPKPFSRGRESLDPRLKSDKAAMERLVFKQKLVSANPNPTIEARDPLPGIYNYFRGSDPNKWSTHVLAYKEVVYRDVWKGIDLKLFAKGPNLEQEFIIHPGADASLVRVSYDGVKGIERTADGALRIRTDFGELTETKPTIFQEVDEKHLPLTGDFNVSGDKMAYAFSVGPRSQRGDLVIDPTLLYSSFLGGSQYDVGNAIAVDNAGNTYITGFTYSTDFPTTTGAFQTSGAGMFVTKVNALGSSMVYSTYLGQVAYGYGIAVDSSGSAVAVGWTYGNNFFPTTANAFSGYCNFSAVITKLTPGGDGLIYSSCLGYGSRANAVAVDSAGNAYITGVGAAGAYPTTPNAFQVQCPNSQGAAVISVVNPSASGASSLIYSSYLGGHPSNGIFPDTGLAIAVDAYGKVYVTGYTSSFDFPVTSGAFMTVFPAGNCQYGQGCLYDNGYRPSGFVAKFDPIAFGVSSLLYATFLGGSLGTEGNGIAVDPVGSAYVTGTTGNYYGGTGSNVPFPTTPGAYQTVADYNDAFVTKLNAAGNGLVYSTLLGGSLGNGTQQGTAIELDGSGDVYVTGWTGAANFPTTPDAFQTDCSGGPAFVTKFNNTGNQLIYSSCFGAGAGGGSAGYGIAVDQVGDAYLTGNTETFSFPVTSFAFQPLFGGVGDAFVTKFPIGSATGVSITGIVPPIGGNAGTVTMSIVGSGFLGDATVELDCAGQPAIQASNVSVSSDSRTITGTFDLTGANPGSCTVQVMNLDGTGASAPQPFTIEAGGAPQMWIDIVGLKNMRGGSPQNYYVVYGNKGNVDAKGIVVSIEIPNVLTWTLLPGQSPIYQIQQGGSTLGVFAVPVVPPQGSAAIVVSLTGPPEGYGHGLPFQFSAWINPR